MSDDERSIEDVEAELGDHIRAVAGLMSETRDLLLAEGRSQGEVFLALNAISGRLVSSTMGLET